MALAPDDAIAQLEREARDDKMAREVLADLHEDRGDTKRAQLWRDCQRDDVYALRFDQLPNRGKTRKRVTKMTDAETAMMKPCADEWIRIGLTTGKADRPLFEAAVDAIYRHMGMTPVPVIWTPAPIVAVLAGPIALYMITRGSSGAVRVAVDDAVRVAVRDAVRGAVHSAVGSARRSDLASPVWSRQDHNNLKQIQSQRGYSWLGGQFWPGWYWGSAYVMYMLDVLRLDIGRDLELKARAYAATVKSACYWYPTTKFIFASERPATIENGGGTWRWADASGVEQTWTVRR